MPSVTPPPSPPLASLALLLLLAATIAIAALANCALLAALFTRTRNGLHFILVQLAVADFVLLAAVSWPELWSQNAGGWTFGNIGCALVKGGDVLASTASVYLVATIALHSLATANVEEAAALREMKKSCDDDEEMRSSRHSLVASSDTSTPPRTMNVEYRVSSGRVRVAPPTLFVWVLSASLSVPQFALAAATRAADGPIVCAIMDDTHRLNIHFMVAVFNLVLPIIIFTFVTVLIIRKLKASIMKRLPNCVKDEVLAGLRLSLCLIIVYMMLCVPRSVLAVYRESWSSEDDLSAPSLGDRHPALTTTLGVAFGYMYLLASLLRPVVAMAALPSLRKMFRFGAQIRGEDL